MGEPVLRVPLGVQAGCLKSPLQVVEHRHNPPGKLTLTAQPGSQNTEVAY